MFCSKSVCFHRLAAPEQDVQHGRAAGPHELLQHRRRHEEDPAEVHTPPRQDTHLQPEQVREHAKDKLNVMLSDRRARQQTYMCSITDGYRG